jgi:hypothetical protein
MSSAHYRSAYVWRVLPVWPVWLVAGLFLFAASIAPRRAEAQAAAAGESDVRASMQCDRASEAGRVRCTVEVRVEGGRTLAWADVEIVALPEFASALKGRIGPPDALARDATSTKWALGLVARRAGQGEARARVRVVACEASATAPPSKCGPVILEVRAQVTVGS